MVKGGFVETDLISISSLTMLYNLFGTPFLCINNVTVVPFSPLILSAAASILIPFVLSPLISRIWSSAKSPARSAGESSNGAIITKLPSRKPICVPIPFKEPLIDCVSSENSFGGKNLVYGSFRLASMVSIATYASSFVFNLLSYLFLHFAQSCWLLEGS